MHVLMRVTKTNVRALMCNLCDKIHLDILVHVH